jgi:hypothetical protein
MILSYLPLPCRLSVWLRIVMIDCNNFPLENFTSTEQRCAESPFSGQTRSAQQDGWGVAIPIGFGRGGIYFWHDLRKTGLGKTFRPVAPPLPRLCLRKSYLGMSVMGGRAWVYAETRDVKK